MTTTGMRQRPLFFSTLLTSLLFLFSIVPFSFAENVEVTYTGAAVAQFYATSAVSDFAACGAELTTDSILIRNQGTVPDTYSIMLASDEISVLEWISISQSSVSLASGKQQEVLVYISPPAGVSGTYTYTVTVASLYDGSETFEKTVTLESCPNVALSTYSTYQETCPCSVGAYMFELSNTERSTETYSLWIEDMDPEYYDLSEYTITLDAGQRKAIYAYVRMACFVYGDFSFSLLAETAESGYIAEIPLVLTVQQACYNYDIAFGEALLFSADEPLDVTFTPKEDTTYTLCQETPAVIPVSLKHSSKIMNEYAFIIEDSEPWIVPGEPYVRLTQNREHITNLVVNTAAADEGLYSFALKVETLRGDLETVVPFTVEIQDCTVEEGYPPWLKYTLGSLLIAVLLAILLVGYFLLGKKKEGMRVGKDASFTSWLKKNKYWLMTLLPLLLLFIILAALAYPVVKEKYAERLAAEAATASEAVSSVQTLFYSWATALILLGLLLLLALLAWYFHFRKKGKKKDVIGKTTSRFFTSESWEKYKPFLKWLWIIFLLLLLLSGLTAAMYFLYQNYKEDAQKYLTEQNTTEETEETTTQDADKKSEEVRALEEQLTTIQEQIAEKEKEIDALQEDVLRLGEEAAQQEASIDEEKIHALLETIKQLEEELTALYEKEAALVDQINALEGRISTVEDHVTDLQKQIDALEEQIDALQKMIAELSAEKTAKDAEQAIADLEEELNELEEQKETLDEELIDILPIEIPKITDDSFETILAFDVSLSGQIVENGQSRFERGIDAAKKYIQEKGIYSVMIVGKNAIIVQRDVSSDRALRTILNLRPLDTQSNLGNALYDAAQELQGQGRVVLISDLLTTDGTDVYAIHDELEKQGIDVIFLNVAQTAERIVTGPQKAEDVSKTTQDESETQEQESPVFVVETQTTESFVIEIPKNADRSIDLNSYFSDEDNDVLLYTAEAGEHLTALIQEHIALLTPEKDWVGETTIVFHANDGKGARVTSPALRVTVFESENTISDTTEEITTTNIEPSEETQKEEKTQTYVPWIILGTIIFLILFSLIMGAFAKRFHQEPPRNEEEKNNDEKKQ